MGQEILPINEDLFDIVEVEQCFFICQILLTITCFYLSFFCIMAEEIKYVYKLADTKDYIRELPVIQIIKKPCPETKEEKPVWIIIDYGIVEGQRGSRFKQLKHDNIYFSKEELLKKTKEKLTEKYEEEIKALDFLVE